MKEQITIEIIPNLFYYYSSQKLPQNIPNALYFNIDQILYYHSFHEDFGPLSLGYVYKYIKSLKEILNSCQQKKEILYHHTSTNFAKKANSALLVCAYQMVVSGKNPYEAYAPFKDYTFIPFRDATAGKCQYECTILDCLLAISYAMNIQWWNFDTFDLQKYEFYEKVENGDITEIIPNKLYAFSSPANSKKDQYGNQLFTPLDYVQAFKTLKIDAVIRLSQNTYEGAQFTKNGIQYYSYAFPQATAPPMTIVKKFCQAVENHERVAVHCKAGLGKTCTLIGCFAIKHFQFDAAHFIAWSRLCRPGSILGAQQYFLIEYEQILLKQGEGSPIRKQVQEKLSKLNVEEEDEGSDQQESLFQFQKHEEEEKNRLGIKEPISSTLFQRRAKMLRKKTFGMERFDQFKIKKSE